MTNSKLEILLFFLQNMFVCKVICTISEINKFMSEYRKEKGAEKKKSFGRLTTTAICLTDRKTGGSSDARRRHRQCRCWFVCPSARPQCRRHSTNRKGGIERINASGRTYTHAVVSCPLCAPSCRAEKARPNMNVLPANSHCQVIVLLPYNFHVAKQP